VKDIMRKASWVTKTAMAAAVVSAVAALVSTAASVAWAQQKDSGTLTAPDYIEIQQLAVRYAYAVDTHADNGYAYADLFAPDGVFGGKTQGREALAKLAMSTQADRGGPDYTRHFLTNVIIYPTPDGARGSQYLVAIDVGEGGKPSSIIHGGRYDDVYVKTPDGWRFKTRQLYPNKIGVPPPTAKIPPAR